jgi:hypothetical protein
MDGVWHKLKLIHEPIKIKGVDEPLDLVVRATHRGVIVTPELLFGAEGVFVSASVPVPKYKHHYSLAWGGTYPGE